MKKQEVPLKKVQRRQYDADFKASAIRMIQQGRSVADVSRALGVHESLLHKWKSASQGSAVGAEPPDAGAPANPDGTLNLVHYAAWLVQQMGRNAGGEHGN